MELKFKCPKCGCSTLEEVVHRAVINTTLTYLDPDGDHDHGFTYVEEGDTDHYRCSRCTWVIGSEEGDQDVCDNEALAEWLLQQPYNQGE